MDIQQLRYFVGVAEAGSISRAAVRLGVAQPTISQQIRRLEERLGVSLFDRLGRGVSLTESGSALLPRALDVLERMRGIESELIAEVEGGGGRLSIGAIPTMAPYMLPGAIAGLRRAYPGCELDIREDLTERLIERIADGTLDIGVMSTPVDHPLIEMRVVARERLVVVASSKSPLCDAGVISLADLRTEAAVTLHEMHCLGRQISEFCSSRRVAGIVSCRMTQIGTLLEFVRMGLGVSIVPELVSRRDGSKGRRYLPFNRGGPTREIAVAMRKGRSIGRLASAFIDGLRSHLEAELS